VEQPLEIRLGTLSYTVTMGTPGDDFDLISLFPCFRRHHLESRPARSLRDCAGEDETGVQTFNVVEAQLRLMPRTEYGRERQHLKWLRHLWHRLD
jgi:FdhD protein